MAVPPPDDAPQGAFGPDGLTPQERLFVEAYMGPAGMVASAAAELAGYRAENRNSLWVTAHRVLYRPRVQGAILLAIARKLDDPEWSKAGVIEIARSSMADFLEVDEAGNVRLDMKKAAEAAAYGCIKEYQEETVSIGDGPEVLRRKIKLHDRLAALKTLLQLQGKLVDKREISGGIGVAVRSGPPTLEQAVEDLRASGLPEEHWPEVVREFAKRMVD